MIIDCQTHIMPVEYVDLFMKNTASVGMEKESDGTIVTTIDNQSVLKTDLSKYDIGQKIREMDALGIDISILSTNIPGPCMLSAELALRGAQCVNNYMAEMIQQYPGRFAGIACLPWQNPQEAILEMNRAVDSLGLCAVMLFSNIGGRPVDLPEFEPVFANAAARGLPIVIHPTFPSWRSAIMDYMLTPMIGFQMDSSLALLRLILGGTMERLPNLKILMPHAGGVLPYMIGRIDYQTEVMGRKPESITEPPSTYLKRVYLDSCSPSVQALKYAWEYSGPERFLLGTDHPWVAPGYMIDLVRSLDISDADKTLIFSTNAQRFFGLS